MIATNLPSDSGIGSSFGIVILGRVIAGVGGAGASAVVSLIILSMCATDFSLFT